MRKRSSLLAAFLATASLAPLLSACSDPTPPQPTVYTDVASCIATNPDKKDDCEKAFSASAAAQKTSAPQYTDKARCEAEFGTGNCETRHSSSGGNDLFAPMMMGYMLGSMNNGPNYYPVYYSTGGGVYSGRQRLGTVPVSSIPSRSGSGYASSARSTTTSFAPSSSFSGARSYASTSSSARGGFGATASARGGCCG